MYVGMLGSPHRPKLGPVVPTIMRAPSGLLPRDGLADVRAFVDRSHRAARNGRGWCYCVVSRAPSSRFGARPKSDVTRRILAEVRKRMGTGRRAL